MTSGQMAEELIHQVQSNRQGFRGFGAEISRTRAFYEAEVDDILLHGGLALDPIEAADRARLLKRALDGGSYSRRYKVAPWTKGIDGRRTTDAYRAE
jgi:hypothetical protein